MVIKNEYFNLLIGRVFKTKINKLDHINLYGPEKCPVFFILPYAGEKLTRIKKYKEVNKKVYCATTPRVIFT